MSLCARVRACARAHTYTHTRTHAHTNTHTHTKRKQGAQARGEDDKGLFVINGKDIFRGKDFSPTQITGAKQLCHAVTNCAANSSEVCSQGCARSSSRRGRFIPIQWMDRVVVVVVVVVAGCSHELRSSSSSRVSVMRSRTAEE